MLITLHVIIALLGILTSTTAVFWPSKPKIRLSASLVALTIITGTILVIETKTHILQTCISGLIYLAFTSSAIILALHRLPAKETSIDR